MALSGTPQFGEDAASVAHTHIERSALARGSDGPIGTVERVVMDDVTGELRALVVHTTLGGQLVELPASYITTINGDEVVLDLSAAAVEADRTLAPLYQPEAYVPVDQGVVLPPGQAEDLAAQSDRPVVAGVSADAVEVTVAAPEMPDMPPAEPYAPMASDPTWSPTQASSEQMARSEAAYNAPEPIPTARQLPPGGTAGRSFGWVAPAAGIAAFAFVVAGYLFRRRQRQMRGPRARAQRATAQALRSTRTAARTASAQTSRWLRRNPVALSTIQDRMLWFRRGIQVGTRMPVRRGAARSPSTLPPFARNGLFAGLETLRVPARGRATPPPMATGATSPWYRVIRIRTTATPAVEAKVKTRPTAR